MHPGTYRALHPGGRTLSAASLSHRISVRRRRRRRSSCPARRRSHLCLPAIAEGKQTIQLDYGRTYVRSPGDVLDPVREPLSALGTLQVWAEPFVKLRLPKLFNLRTDPFERADVTSNTYYDWFLHRDYIIFAAQFIARQFAPTFKEFPPAQKAASFTIDDALDKMNDAVGGAGH